MPTSIFILCVCVLGGGVGGGGEVAKVNLKPKAFFEIRGGGQKSILNPR